MRTSRDSSRALDAHPANCHLPAALDPPRHRALVQSVHRLASAASWLEREVVEQRECYAALSQVGVLEIELHDIALQLLDSHLRHCVMSAIKDGRTPDEIAHLLAPISTLLFTSSV